MDRVNVRPTKLLWVDLETTGLDPHTYAILEIQAFITDFQFRKLATFHAVVHQPEAVLNAADDWCKTMHTSNGLFDRVRKEGEQEDAVIASLATLIQSHFQDELAILAGGNVHFDREFIRHQWPAINSLLHYRSLDVSAWKIFMQGRFNVVYKPQKTHRSNDDLEDSIHELTFYLDWFASQAKK